MDAGLEAPKHSSVQDGPPNRKHFNSQSPLTAMAKKTTLKRTDGYNPLGTALGSKVTL